MYSMVWWMSLMTVINDHWIYHPSSQSADKNNLHIVFTAKRKSRFPCRRPVSPEICAHVKRTQFVWLGRIVPNWDSWWNICVGCFGAVLVQRSLSHEWASKLNSQTVHKMVHSHFLLKSFDEGHFPKGDTNCNANLILLSLIRIEHFSPLTGRFAILALMSCNVRLVVNQSYVQL